MSIRRDDITYVETLSHHSKLMKNAMKVRGKFSRHKLTKVYTEIRSTILCTFAGMTSLASN